MDPEIKAMADVAAAVKDLEPEAMRRVLKWANERFQIKPSASATVPQQATGEPETHAAFNEFHELYEAAKPETGLAKVLVAAYWFEVVLKHENFDSQEINKELKHMGSESTNITRDLDHLINRTPRQVTHVRKEGKTKQGRRLYKLTREGIRSVERMLNNTENNADGAA